MAWSMTGRVCNAACSWVASRCGWARICALRTDIAAGTANSSPTCSAWSSNASWAWAYAFIASITPQGPRSGSDRTLCTPILPARGPNRGHRRSPPSDPDRIVWPCAAAVMHGPCPMPSWMSSICRTNSALLTTTFSRFGFQQGQSSAFRTRNRLYCHLRDPGQLLNQTHPPSRELRQFRQTGREGGILQPHPRGVTARSAAIVGRRTVDRVITWSLLDHESPRTGQRRWRSTRHRPCHRAPVEVAQLKSPA